jgi:hypothetical protein
MVSKTSFGRIRREQTLSATSAQGSLPVMKANAIGQIFHSVYYQMLQPFVPE